MNWDRKLAALPSSWYEDSLRSECRSTRAIAAAFSVLSGDHTEEEVIAIFSPQVTRTSLKNARRVIDTCPPEVIRKSWNGDEGFAVTRLYETRVKYREEIPDAPRKRDERALITYADNLREFIGMLSQEALHKAFKHQIAVFHPDKGGDAAKATRLNALWSKIKQHQGDKI